MTQFKEVYYVGQVLIHLGVITHQQVIEARAHQMDCKSRKPIGEIMIALGYITEDELQRALSLQRDIFEN